MSFPALRISVISQILLFPQNNTFYRNFVHCFLSPHSLRCLTVVLFQKFRRFCTILVSLYTFFHVADTPYCGVGHIKIQTAKLRVKNVTSDSEFFHRFRTAEPSERQWEDS